MTAAAADVVVTFHSVAITDRNYFTLSPLFLLYTILHILSIDIWRQFSPLDLTFSPLNILVGCRAVCSSTKLIRDRFLYSIIPKKKHFQQERRR